MYALWAIILLVLGTLLGVVSEGADGIAAIMIGIGIGLGVLAVLTRNYGNDD